MTDYKCTACGAVDVKLWREYGRMVADVLRCADCVCNHHYLDPDEVAADGTIPDPNFPDERTTAIGWMVPAVTDEDGSYWGYTSFPEEAFNRWQAMPLRQVGVTELHADAGGPRVTDEQVAFWPTELQRLRSENLAAVNGDEYAPRYQSRVIEADTAYIHALEEAYETLREAQP